MLEQIRTFAMAERVFTSPRRADRWMARPNRKLGGMRPVDLASTEEGAEQVGEVLASLAESKRRNEQASR
jgi:uncharacterized protein (DUF2384 family)